MYFLNILYEKEYVYSKMSALLYYLEAIVFFCLSHLYKII